MFFDRDESSAKKEADMSVNGALHEVSHRPSMTDLYADLGIPRGASPDDVKKAYRKLALRLHPDKNPGDSAAAEQFRRVAHAYEVLSDPERRERYDATGQDGTEAPGHEFEVDISHLFSNLFGGGFSPFGPAHHFAFGGAAEEDAAVRHVDVRVSMMDVMNGARKTVELDTNVQCSKCSGSGAKDPSDVVQCPDCEGRGSIMRPFGPMMMMSAPCGRCAGAGVSVRAGRACDACRGAKRVPETARVEVPVPVGVRHGHETTVNHAAVGALNVRFLHHGFEHEVDDSHNVRVCLAVGLPEVLCGLRRVVDVCGETHVVEADGYFDPSKARVVRGGGLPRSQHERGDLVVTFDVSYSGVDARRIRLFKPALERIFLTSEAAPRPAENL